MNLDITVVSRTGYTFLDVLSDVGGLEAIVVSFMAIAIQIINHNDMDTFLVTFLYKTEEGNFTRNEISGVKEWLKDHLNGKLTFCCKRNKRQDMIVKARELLDAETDVINLVK